MIAFKKYSTRFALVSMIVILAATAVSAQKNSPEVPPADPEDSSLLTLMILLDGDTLELTLEDSDGALLAAFNASEGDEVTVTMEAEDIDPYLVLFGASGALVAQNDDADGLNSQIADFEVPADGTYFILATTFSNRNNSLIESSDELAFTLTVEGNTQPASESEDGFSYYSYTTTIGETLELIIDEVQPAYFVTFEGAEGDELTINAPSEDNELDTLMMLFDASGKRFAVDDDSGEESLASMIETELPIDGLYFLVVTTYNYPAIAVGDSDALDGTINLSIDG